MSRDEMKNWGKPSPLPAPEPAAPSGAVCADCHHPKDDSRFHHDAPGTNWGAALHWFKTAPSGASLIPDDYYKADEGTVSRLAKKYDRSADAGARIGAREWLYQNFAYHDFINEAIWTGRGSGWMLISDIAEAYAAYRSQPQPPARCQVVEDFPNGEQGQCILNAGHEGSEHPVGYPDAAPSQPQSAAAAECNCGNNGGPNCMCGGFPAPVRRKL
jgi:hypothetical protein